MLYIAASVSFKILFPSISAKRSTAFGMVSLLSINLIPYDAAVPCTIIKGVDTGRKT